MKVLRYFVKRGRHPSKKTAFTFFLKSMTRGKTPIEKNIAVVDEQGNQYEATWPKRARGLVKNGRARFISENKICLACPPNIILEDVAMSDRMINEANAGAVHNGGVDGQFGRGYILKQIDKILEQKDYLFEAIKGLSNMSDGKSVGTGQGRCIEGYCVLSGIHPSADAEAVRTDVFRSEEGRLVEFRAAGKRELNNCSLSVSAGKR